MLVMSTAARVWGKSLTANHRGTRFSQRVSDQFNLATSSSTNRTLETRDRITVVAVEDCQTLVTECFTGRAAFQLADVSPVEM